MFRLLSRTSRARATVVCKPLSAAFPRAFKHTAPREPADDAKFPSFSGKTQLFINNKFVDSKSGKTFPTYNAGNGQVLAQVAEAQKEDVDAAVDAAHNAFYNGPARFYPILLLSPTASFLPLFFFFLLPPPALAD
jgi:hypothetical protein